MVASANRIEIFSDPFLMHIHTTRQMHLCCLWFFVNNEPIVIETNRFEGDCAICSYIVLNTVS